MKSITIHNMDDDLSNMLKKQAFKSGKSLNRTIKEILSGFFGLQEKRTSYRSDFAGMCGSWSPKDVAEFNRRSKDLQQVDPGDWE